jgi:hypothetical protein
MANKLATEKKVAVISMLAEGTSIRATERIVTVLEIPPVDSPQTAVKMAIYSDIKKGKVAPK